MLDKTRAKLSTSYGADAAAALTNPERIRRLPMGQRWGAGPIGADTWATATRIPGWTRVQTPQPGDMVAQYNGGLDGHVGIVTYIGDFVDPAPDGRLPQEKRSTLATTSATELSVIGQDGKYFGVQQNDYGGRPGSRPTFWRSNLVIELQRREGPSSYKGQKMAEPYKVK